jgi:hypothetical protein
VKPRAPLHHELLLFCHLLPKDNPLSQNSLSPRPQANAVATSPEAVILFSTAKGQGDDQKQEEEGQQLWLYQHVSHGQRSECKHKLFSTSSIFEKHFAFFA